MVTQSRPAAKRKSFGARLKFDFARNWRLYVLILPALTALILFRYAPMYGLQIAFKNFKPAKGISGSAWVGLKHFKSFINSYQFENVLWNTIKISVTSLIAGFPMPIIFALLLNQIRSAKAKKVLQTVTYMPHFISTVIICGLMLDFCGEKGVLTSIICGITGMQPTNLFSKSAWFQPLYVIMSIWQEFGWDSIIYYAAVTGIDQALYEAAEIDGANRWQKIWNVTIPGISQTIVILLVMRVGNMMTLGWDKILLLYNPMTYKTSDVISTYVYRIGLTNFQYSFATAVGFFNSIINFILLILANTVSKKVNETSLW